MGVSSGDYYSIGEGVWLCGGWLRGVVGTDGGCGRGAGAELGFEARAEAEQTVGEVRVFEDELEGGPVGGREVGAMKKAGGSGGLEFGIHGAVERLSEVGGEALEVPVIVAEFGGSSGVTEFGEQVVVGEELVNRGVFFHDTVGFAGAVDGGIGVIKAVVVIGGVGEDDAAGKGPDFEREAEVLVGGAGGGKEFKVVVQQEVAAINSGPDSGSEGEDAAVVARVNELAGVAGADFGGFEGFGGFGSWGGGLGGLGSGG